MLSEIVRVLQRSGYLIIREHDCKNEQSLTAKYLNFVHAFMMMARVGEFADIPTDCSSRMHDESDEDSGNGETTWEQQKSKIIEYTRSIQYRTRDEWQKKLEYAGFRHIATLSYGADGSKNPLNLFYAVYRLNTK